MNKKLLLTMILILLCQLLLCQHKCAIASKYPSLELELINIYIGEKGKISSEYLKPCHESNCHNTKCLEINNSIRSIISRNKNEYYSISRDRIILESIHKIRSHTSNLTTLSRVKTQLICLSLSYQLMHEIIHDRLLRLYDWHEFYGFVEDLESEWSLFLLLANNQDWKNKELFDIHLIKFNDCLEELKDSIHKNPRNEYELPCNNMEIALKELISYLYKEEYKYLF